MKRIMNIFNGNRFMTAALWMALAAAPGLVSCSDWTTPESLPIHEVTLEDDAELQNRYFQSLRDYKQSEHMVTIVKYDNITGTPATQADRVYAIPDSVDYVILTAPDNLSETVISEMAGCREGKGTLFLHEVSYDDILLEHEAYLEEWEEARAEMQADAAEDVPEEAEPVSFADFLQEKVSAALSLTGKYGYDGLNVYYGGVFPESLGDDARKELEANQKIFFDAVTGWIATNQDKIFLFEGKPVNVTYDHAFLQGCRYFIVDSREAATEPEFGVDVNMAYDATADAFLSDRIILGVTMPSMTDTADGTGYFTDAEGNEVNAPTGASRWLMKSVSSYTRCGLCISRAKNDYYNQTSAYGVIRDAISYMNPSPLN